MYGLILIRIKAKDTQAFLHKARTLKGVIEANVVYGRFDVAVLIEGKDHLEMNTVATNLMRIEGIKSTETLGEIAS